MIRFPWKNSGVPHAVLELTNECNLACMACYRLKRHGCKSVDAVLDEFRLLRSHQNLHTVSLVGGEPTLHPELDEIVRFLRAEGVRVALISNGVNLKADRLNALKRAGLDLALLHVDEGQSRPGLAYFPPTDEINELRRRLCQMVSAAGIEAGLTVTIYPETVDRVPALFQCIIDEPAINYALITHAANLTKASSVAQTRNADVMGALDRELGLRPFAGVSGFGPAEQSSLLSYLVPVRYGDMGPEVWCSRSTALDLWLIQFARGLAGRYTFFCPSQSFATTTQVFVNALGSGRMLSGLSFLCGAGPVHAKRILMEDSPVRDSSGNLVCSEYCPNNTVRDGKVVPVCQADVREKKQ